MTDDRRPKRIQRQRTKGWRMPAGAVYVGRPTKWGNPFVVGSFARRLDWAIVEVETAADAVELYRQSAMDNCAGAIFRRNVRNELRGKDLVCWCSLDQPCHADVLLEIANA